MSEPLESFDQAWETLLNSIGLDEWEFEIRYEGRRYTILAWDPDWETNSPGIGVFCPTGSGDSLSEAINDLKSRLRGIKSKVSAQSQPFV